jgi:peptide/nickel transport system substrate-binding protein
LKRLWLAFLVAAFAMLIGSTVSAHEHGLTVHFNGRRIHFDAAPTVQSGRTLVPFRAIFEKMGADVAFDGATQRVTATRGTTRIELTINSTLATVNGRAVTLDVAPQIVSRRTLVPLRFISEAMGAAVLYDGGRQRVDINDPSWPPRGGGLNLSLISSPAHTFHPYVSSNVYDSYILGNVHTGLWYSDDALFPRPSLATHWTISPDNKEITFYIKDGARFHDGRPVTIDDVIFSFTSFFNPNYKGPRTTGWNNVVGYDEYRSGQASTVAGIQRVGNNGIRFVLKDVYAPFFLNNTGYSIIPKHLYENVPVEDWGTAKDPHNTKPIGAGAFKFAQMVPGQFYVLDRNPDYHDGAPYLDRVIFRVVSQEILAGELAIGRVDYAEQFPVKDIETARKLPHVEVKTYPDLTMQYMGFNTQRAPLNDKKVRQAIAYAVDRRAIISGIMENNASFMAGPIHPLYWSFDPDHPQYEFDLAMARRLLDEAGWRVGSDGIRAKDGKRFKVTLLYPTGNVQRMNTAPVVQAMLREVGIEVELELTDFATLLSKSGVGVSDYDLLFLGFRLGTGDPDPTGIHGKVAISPGGFNRHLWTTDTSERLLDAAVRTLDLDERRRIYAEWARHFQEEMPFLHLYATNAITAVAKKIGNFKQRPADSTWNLSDWYVKQ